MKNNKNIKIFKIISCFACVIVSVFFSIINPLVNEGMILDANDTNITDVFSTKKLASSNPTVNISSQYTNDGCYTPTNSGNIYITISLSAKTDHDVKVYFHAADGTAVSEAGDYYCTSIGTSSSASNSDKAKDAHKQSYVTIQAGKTTSGVNYYTTKTPLISKDTSGNILRNYFYFCIDDVVGATVSTTKYKCGLNYNICNEMFVSNTGLRYKNFEYNSWSFDRDDVGDDDIPDWATYVCKEESYTNLVKSGLANIYVRFSIDIDGSFTNKNYYKARLWIAGRPSAGYVPNNSRLLLQYYDDDFWDSSGWASPQNSTGNNSGFGGEWAKANKDYGYHIYWYAFDKCGWMVSRDASIYLEAAIFDQTAPKIKGYYIDASGFKTDKKITLACKFTEPVQVADPANTAILGSFWAEKTEEVKFAYAGGAGSDTLLFELPSASVELAGNNKQISSFSFTELKGSIGDYGKSTNGDKANWVTGSKTYITGTSRIAEPSAKCDIDLRVPEVTIKSISSLDITQTRSIDVTVNRMAAGTVYYVWKKDGNLVLNKPTDYDTYENITRDGSSSHTFTITATGMTGEYYLYFMAVSEFGIPSSAKFGRSKSDGTIIGGYLFDNTKPTVDSSSIVKDSLVEKVFSLDLYDGNKNYDSGISQVYINICKDKEITHAEATPIYTASSNKMGISGIGYELNSQCIYLKSNYDELNEKWTVTGTALDGYVFSSVEAAIEFVTLCEYYDMTIERKYNDESFELAPGESKPTDADSAFYIRYKVTDFKVSSYTATADQNIADGVGHTEYVYYRYAGTDKTTLEIDKLSENLLSAVNDVAANVVSKGNVVDLIEKNYLTEDYTDIVNTKTSFVKTVTLASCPYLSSNLIKDQLTYKDKKFKLTSAGGSYLYCLTAEALGIGENKFGYFTVWFTVVDGAGNTSVVPKSKSYLKFDTRILFSSTVDVTLDGYNTNSIDINHKAYDIDKGTVALVAKTQLTPDDSGTIGVKNVYYQNSDTPLATTEYDKYIQVGTATSIGTVDSQIIVTFKEPGYYKFEFCLVGGINADPTKQKISEEYEYYITKSMTDNTLNYKSSQGNNVLNNQVFQLGTSYYYMDSNSKKQELSYNNIYKELDPTVRLSGEQLATFSSKSVATSYVQYMEQQDFSLLILNSTTAETLNNGANKDFIKADGESKTAYSGQAWIRYKRRTWTVNSTEYDWVYYYYGETGTTSITINNISDNLKAALYDVTTYIIKTYGYDVNLVGADYTDSFGAPKLADTQKHAEVETKSTSRTGSQFVPALEYKGDKELYQNSVTVNDIGGNTVMSLSSNSVLHTENLNHVYYAYFNGSVDVSMLSYTQLEFSEGQTYRQAINGGTGIYYIREFGKEGINQYSVYIDNSAPCIQVIYRSATDNVAHSPTFDSSTNGQTFSSKSFSIGAIDSVYERDELSYVAIYNKNNMKLLYTYFYEYLQTNFVNLETGEYYIVVSDRSGNSYNFNVYVNDSELEVTATIVDNDYVQVSINRNPNQIYLYEVYLNNNPQPLDKTWENSTNLKEIYSKKYRQSGNYRIVVRDIYGFSVEIGGDSSCNYERDLPKITWSYLGDDGNYHRYEEKITTCMTFTQSLGSTIFINTSKTVRFTMDGEYEYSFDGLEKGDYTSDFMGNVVTIKAEKDWELDIWYVDYPDIKAHYVCRMDTMAPEIVLTYKSSTWALEEAENISLYEETAKVGSIYTPTSIGYKLVKETNTTINEGDTVNSNLIKVDLFDTSGVASLQIYLNGEILKEYPEGLDDTSIISLSRYGNYKIIAVDVFGNKRTFEFKNNVSQYSTYKVDEQEQEIRKSDVVYGHDNSTVIVNNDGLVSIKVTNDVTNKSYVNLYNVKNGRVTIAQYQCSAGTEEDNYTKNIQLVDKTYKGINNYGEEVDIVNVLLDANDTTYRVGKWYQVLYADKDGFDLYLSYDKEKNIIFKVGVQDDKSTIEYRASFDDKFEPYYYKTCLSKEITNATLLDVNSQPIETKKDGLTYINNNFSFDQTINPDITSITISYSATKDFNEIIDVYPTTLVVDDEEVIGVTQFDTSANGFYQIVVTNIYNNKVTYTINRSDVFVVLTEASYDDGNYNRYTEVFEDTTKSNKQIKLEAYSADATFEVTKDGIAFEPSIVKADDFYTLTFNQVGSYVVKCIDNYYGNIVTKNLVINHSSIVYNDDLLNGYNSKAKIDNNYVYTNNKLSISEAKIAEYQIKYLSVKYNDVDTILLNLNSQTIINYDASTLVDYIGSLGDGLYVITIKDQYGSFTTRTIDYKATTTINITRTTRAATSKDEYEISDVVANGIYSNASIDITGDAKYYTLLVDNEVCQLPYQFALTFQSGSATISHDVSYKDEYGNEYSFVAVLERKDLVLTVDDSVSLTLIDNIPTTKNNVILSFTEGNCTYTVDGSEEMPYISNQLLKKDGYYRFTLKDRAGNITTQAVKKDTFVDYTFIDNSTETAIINKQVINKGPVSLKSNNNDNVSIKCVYIDGEKLEKYGKDFTAQGHYVILLTDKIGNESLFEFYLLKYEISVFSYTTPISYKITDAWYSTGDGNFVNYMNSGAINQFDSYSTIELIENGIYQITMTSELYASGVSFGIEINNTAPTVNLVGCEDGEQTLEDISINGYSVGDTIYIYKDGELLSKTEITSILQDSPIITDGGDYEVVVVNRAGVSTTLKFAKKKIADDPGSALIIILCCAISIGILIGVVLRNKQKFDE